MPELTLSNVPWTPVEHHRLNMTAAEVRDSLALTASDICAAATDASGNILGGLAVNKERLASVIVGIHGSPGNNFCPTLWDQHPELIIFIGLSFSATEIESMAWKVAEFLKAEAKAFTAQSLPRRWLFHPDIVALMLEARFFDERFLQFRKLYWLVNKTRLQPPRAPPPPPPATPPPPPPTTKYRAPSPALLPRRGARPPSPTLFFSGPLTEDQVKKEEEVMIKREEWSSARLPSPEYYPYEGEGWAGGENPDR